MKKDFTKERAMNFNSDKLPMSDVFFLVLNSCRLMEAREKFLIITVLLHYLPTIHQGAFDE